MVTMSETGEKLSEPLKSPEPKPTALSRIAGFLRLLTCQRRCKTVEEEKERALVRYNEYVALGQQVPQRKQEDWYDRLAWWSDVKTKQGSRVFVLAPRGPQGETDYQINMRELLGFALSKMHKVVAEEDTRFAVVWVQQSDHRVGPWMAWRFSESLHEKYAKNLEAIHVVHPSWTVRFLRLVLWPLASDEFWDYFHSHERIEFLDVALDMRKFRLPKDIVEYDQWLDKQAEELHKQQALKHGQGPFMGTAFGGMGGMGSSGGDEERKKLEEQIEEMKRALQQKGHTASSAKDD